jgi:hypothetical protein
VKAGDLVLAIDGPIVGMMGLITYIASKPPRMRHPHLLASVMWRNGDHQADVSIKYLEIIK